MAFNIFSNVRMLALRGFWKLCKRNTYYGHRTEITLRIRHIIYLSALSFFFTKKKKKMVESLLSLNQVWKAATNQRRYYGIFELKTVCVAQPSKPCPADVIVSTPHTHTKEERGEKKHLSPFSLNQIEL